MSRNLVIRIWVSDADSKCLWKWTQDPRKADFYFLATDHWGQCDPTLRTVWPTTEDSVTCHLWQRMTGLHGYLKMSYVKTWKYTYVFAMFISELLTDAYYILMHVFWWLLSAILLAYKRVWRTPTQHADGCDPKTFSSASIQRLWRWRCQRCVATTFETRSLQCLLQTSYSMYLEWGRNNRGDMAIYA